jgi:hypothetical protein
MLQICLLALPWLADPALSGPTVSGLGLPFATCARPAAMVIKPNPMSAFSVTSDTDSKAINRWLSRWEKATRYTPDRSRSEQEEFRQRIHAEFNEHTLAAVEKLVGHIHLFGLKKEFDWRIVDQNVDAVCLEATPLDELERLFYGSLRVSLDPETGSPIKLVVIGRNQFPRTVWQSEDSQAIDQIELVHFENDVPPAPNSVVRTADVRVERR